MITIGVMAMAKLVLVVPTAVRATVAITILLIAQVTA
jgi:hypothetical protein